ncbi:MAG: hypothetical protein KKB70_12035, partial [Proteobacteria bacterium]|nr:hypothetical protein [Pseudomonadota bacterium]
RYKFADPSSRVLDLVLERYRPKLWYFGHYHRFRQGEAEGCRWTCLACPPWQGGYGRHWVFLEEE